jgi:hypothetical protein
VQVRVSFSGVEMLRRKAAQHDMSRVCQVTLLKPVL